MVQRTKLIDETQDMLLEMLEDMTTGKTHLSSINPDCGSTNVKKQIVTATQRTSF